MKILINFVIATFCAFVLGQEPTHGQPHSRPHLLPCKSFDNCNACASQNGCVWCNNQDTCLSNQNLGTAANQCYNGGGQSLVFTELGCSTCD